jgi:hypothetical protein
MIQSISHIRFDQKPPLPPPPAAPQYCPILTGFDYADIPQYFNYYVYTWLNHGNSFWMVPVDLIGEELFCYAWDGLDWNYIRLDTKLIDSVY